MTREARHVRVNTHMHAQRARHASALAHRRTCMRANMDMLATCKHPRPCPARPPSTHARTHARTRTGSFFFSRRFRQFQRLDGDLRRAGVRTQAVTTPSRRRRRRRRRRRLQPTHPPTHPTPPACCSLPNPPIMRASVCSSARSTQPNLSRAQPCPAPPCPAPGPAPPRPALLCPVRSQFNPTRPDPTRPDPTQTISPTSCRLWAATVLVPCPDRCSPDPKRGSVRWYAPVSRTAEAAASQCRFFPQAAPPK